MSHYGHRIATGRIAGIKFIPQLRTMTKEAMKKVYFNILNGSVKVITEGRMSGGRRQDRPGNAIEARMSHAEYFEKLVRKLRDKRRRRDVTRRLVIETKIDLLLDGKK